jgi:hypothetical protein
MKHLHVLAIAATLATCFYAIGCETSHTVTDKPSITGGTTHEETTTTHNPLTNTNDTTYTETKTH